MTVTDTNETTHQTRTFSYSTEPGPHNITTWWGWECSCGKGDTGVGAVFASDLAYTHEQRVLACTCANPTITTRPRFIGGDYTATASCDCGFTGFATSHFLHGSRWQAVSSARHMLETHTCRTLSGHSHDHPAPTIVSAER